MFSWKAFRILLPFFQYNFLNLELETYLVGAYHAAGRSSQLRHRDILTPSVAELRKGRWPSRGGGSPPLPVQSLRAILCFPKGKEEKKTWAFLFLSQRKLLFKLCNQLVFRQQFHKHFGINLLFIFGMTCGVEYKLPWGVGNTKKYLL